MFKLTVLARIIILSLVAAAVASAATVSFDVSTNSGSWNIVNFSGTSMSTAAYVPAGATFLSVSSNAYNTGTSVDPSTQFNGFWVAELTFSLPSGAYNAVLTFDNLVGDDRVLLQVNGATVGNATVYGDNGSGVMSTSSGGGAAYTFDNTTNGTVLLTAGTSYTMSLIVNNTGTGMMGDPTAGFLASTDGTMAGLQGTVSYQVGDSPVPEPASLSFLLLGAVPLGLALRKRRCH